MDNITRLKLIFGFAIGFVALVSGALPQLFKKFFRRRFLWLSIANVCFKNFVEFLVIAHSIVNFKENEKLLGIFPNLPLSFEIYGIFLFESFISLRLLVAAFF
jgi:hypothetical protein